MMAALGLSLPFPVANEVLACHIGKPWTHCHLRDPELSDTCLLLWTYTGRILAGHTLESLLSQEGEARAVWNNNLMFTVALTESQAQAQVGHGWAPANEVTQARRLLVAGDGGHTQNGGLINRT